MYYCYYIYSISLIEIKLDKALYVSVFVKFKHLFIRSFLNEMPWQANFLESTARPPVQRIPRYFIIIIIMYSIYIAPFLLDSLIIKGAFSLSRCYLKFMHEKKRNIWQYLKWPNFWLIFMCSYPRQPMLA